MKKLVSVLIVLLCLLFAQNSFADLTFDNDNVHLLWDIPFGVSLEEAKTQIEENANVNMEENDEGGYKTFLSTNYTLLDFEFEINIYKEYFHSLVSGNSIGENVFESVEFCESSGVGVEHKEDVKQCFSKYETLVNHYIENFGQPALKYFYIDDEYYFLDCAPADVYNRLQSVGDYKFFEMGCEFNNVLVVFTIYYLEDLIYLTEYKVIYSAVPCDVQTPNRENMLKNWENTSSPEASSSSLSTYSIDNLAYQLPSNWIDKCLVTNWHYAETLNDASGGYLYAYLDDFSGSLNALAQSYANSDIASQFSYDNIDFNGYEAISFVGAFPFPYGNDPLFTVGLAIQIGESITVLRYSNATSGDTDQAVKEFMEIVKTIKISDPDELVKSWP